MKKNKGKISLICWFIGAFISLIGLILACVFGIGMGIACAIVFIFMCVLGIVSAVQDIKGIGNNLSDNQLLSQYDKKLLNQFKSIKDEEYNEVNYVSFVNEGIKFSAKGKFGCVKDFNGIRGYHLGFNIEGLKLVDKPQDYEDIVNYEDLLFSIDLGYFENILLSQPENDKGIIVDDIGDLEGKTIHIQGRDGYVATIRTAESDEIDVGEIKFIEWKKNSKIIKFKLVVGYGLGDVVVGTVKLIDDKQ